MDDSRNNKFHNRVTIGALILQLLLIGVIMFGFEVEDMTLGQGEMSTVDIPMTLTYEDGSSIAVPSLPFYPSSKAEESVTLSATLPDDYRGKCLVFLSADKEFTVYVDGKEIYEFGTKDHRLFGNTPGSNLNFIQLPGEFSDGELRIVSKSHYDDYASYITQMYVADKDVAIMSFFRENAGKLGCSLIMVFCGIFVLILAVLQRGNRQSVAGMPYLGFLMVTAALYYGVETKMLSILHGNQTLYSFLIFSTIMMFPIYLLNYYRSANRIKFKRTFDVILTLSYLNVSIQIGLQLMDVIDFLELAPFAHAIMYIGVLLVEIEYIFQLIEKGDKTILLEIIAMASIIVGGGADLVLARIVRVGDLGRFSRIGTTLFGLLMVFVHIKRIAIESRRKAELNLETIKQHNAELLISEKKAEAANRAKSEFLSQMSHEIRTPINAVLGMNEMIIRESDDKKILEYASAVKDSGNALLSIVSDVLDITKIESGKLEVVERPYELYPLLHDCYNMIKERAAKKEFDLYFSVDEMLPSALVGDAAKIRQVIMNLLTNAVKYTDEGSVELVVIGEDAGDDILLHIIVKDTGTGINEENLSKLFEKFQRVDLEHNQTIEGTGLGLAITKSITEAMGGTISVSSEFGKGSVFRVELIQKISDRKPVGEVDFERAKKENAELGNQNRASFTAQKARILVVDDVETNLMVFASLLKKTKMQIDKAQSGFECLDLIHKNEYDIIFMDHMMPELDGVETFKRIRADESDDNLNKDTPVIMLTANAISGVREEYLETGFADYLSKPIHADLLEEVILNFLPEDKVDDTNG